MTYEVQFEGLDKVMRKLDRGDAQKALIVGLNWGMDRVQKELMEYPPETIANRPHQVVNKDGSLSALRWYERDVGQHVRDRLYRTSEKLKKKWRQRVFVVHGKIMGRLRNTASYAKYVHGDKDQSTVMAKIGWEKGGVVAEKFRKKIEKTILDTFKKKWRQ